MKVLSKTSLLALVLLLFFTKINAQSDQSTVLINGNAGALFNDDGRNFSDRIMLGFEINYFIKPGIAFTGGLDYLTANNGATMGVFGTRIYPGSGSFFLRHRSMINLNSRFNSDFLLGVGYDAMLNDNFALEFNVDYHFVSQGVGVRAGIGVFL